MQVWLPEQKRLDETRFFLWMRIVTASMSAIIGVWQVWTNAHDPSRWVEWLSMACLFTFLRLRQPGESRRAYLTADWRAVVTNLSALAVVVSSIWFLVKDAR